jgi:hypothetical protein
MNSWLRNSIVPSLLLALLLAGGALTVWGLAMGALGSAYVERSRKLEVVELLRVTNSGQPIIESYRRRSRDPHLFSDLERRPARLSEVEPQREGKPPAFLRSHSLSKAERFQHWLAPESSFSIRGLNNGGMSRTNWFLRKDEESTEHAYLVGYDLQSKHCIGYVGVRGFRLDKPSLDDQFAIGARSMNVASAALHSDWGRANPFSGDRTPLLIISDDKLYAVDLQFAAPEVMNFTLGDTGQTIRLDRTVRLLPLDEPVLSMNYAKQGAEDDSNKDEEQRIVVRTPKHVLLLDMLGQTLRSAEIPPALLDLNFSVYLPVGDEIIFAVNNSDDDKNETDLTWVNTKTAAMRSEKVVLYKRMGDRQKVAWVSAAIVPSPAVLGVFYYELWPALRHPALRLIDASAYRAGIWNASWPILMLVGLLSMAAAAYAYRRQKCYGPRGAIAWAIFVLIAGPAGLLGYLWHRRWPVVERCASCGVDVPRNRGDCLACHTEFSAPKQLGCEVFA